MAFEVNIKTKYGISCKYWKISKIEKDYTSKSSYIILYGYMDSNMRKQNKDCLEKRYVNIYPKDFDSVFGIEQLSKKNMNDLKSVYRFIRCNFPEFADAYIC